MSVQVIDEQRTSPRVTDRAITIDRAGKRGTTAGDRPRGRQPTARPRSTQAGTFAGTLIAMTVTLADSSGCTASAPLPDHSDKPGTAATPKAPPPPAAAYAIHEWGLLFAALDGRVHAAIGPARPAFDPLGLGLDGIGEAAQPGDQGDQGLGLSGIGAGGGKPILWFHPDPGTPAFAAEVRVELPNGRVLEAWPVPSEGDPGAGDAKVIAWRGVEVRPGSCPGAIPAPSDSFDEGSAPCPKTSDGICESATLADARTTDAACAVLNGVEYNHLFYRGEMGTLGDLGVTVALDDAGVDPMRASVHLDATVQRVGGAGRPASVPAFRVVRALDGSAQMGKVDVGTDVVRISPPIEPMDVEAFFAPLATAKLTEQEVAAFRRTWESSITSPLDPGLDDQWPGAPRDAIYLWISSAELDALAPVHATPAPRALHRVALLRVALDRPSPAGPPPEEIALASGTTSQGSYSAATVHSYVSARAAALHRCWRASEAPAIDANLELTIDSLGRVKSAKLAAKKTAPGLEACIERVAKRWRLPIPSNNLKTTASVPLRLR